MPANHRFVSIAEEVGTVLDPIATMAAAPSGDVSRDTARRVAGLDGQVLAVIDNDTNPGLRLGLVRRLTEQFRLTEVITVIKDTVNVPPRPEDWKEVTSRATVGLALFGS